MTNIKNLIAEYEKIQQSFNSRIQDLVKLDSAMVHSEYNNYQGVLKIQLEKIQLEFLRVN